MQGPSPLLALALAALLVTPGLLRPAARGWVITFLATLALFIGLLALAPLLAGARGVAGGPLLALAGVLGIASMLVQRAGLSWHAMGFTRRQRPGSGRAALAVSALVLGLHVLALQHGASGAHRVPLAAWLQQAALPGLVEEAVFRGVLLALLDQAFQGRRRVFGVPLGWGAVVVTLVFVALHGLSPGTLLGVLPASLLYLWLRVHTGSLVVPVLVHHLWNLAVLATRP